MLNIDDRINDIIKKVKNEISEDIIFQDREYYQEPVQTWKATYNSKKRQMDLGKLVNNLQFILYQDPKNIAKRNAIFRYFITVLDAEKHHLDYRAFRSEILHKYRELVHYI